MVLFNVLVVVVKRIKMIYLNMYLFIIHIDVIHAGKDNFFLMEGNHFP